MRHNSRIITEKEIRYAMEITNSVSQAATFLRINVLSFKKYASMFIDKETGKTLYELQLNRRGTDIAKRMGVSTAHTQNVSQKYFIEVLQGKHPNYSYRRMTVERLVSHGFKAEKCECCGFSERRDSDGQQPLVVIYKDNDKTNFLIENLLILCHNCSFLQYGYYKHVPASYNDAAFSFIEEAVVDPELLVNGGDDYVDTESVDNSEIDIPNDFEFTQEDIDAVKRNL